MRKIITILCTLIFTINLSANAAMISVNEDSLMFTESKEEEEIIENKNNEGICENNEIKQNNSDELISDSEIEKVDENILSYDESNNITTEDENFIMQEQSESKLYIPYEYKNKLKISDGKVFNTFKAEKNKSYTIENNSNSSKEIRFYQEDSKDYKYDFVDYNKNGDSINSGIDEESMNIFVDDNTTKKITFSEDVYLYTLYEDLLDIKQVNTPVVYRTELITGQSYELINKSNNKISIAGLEYNSKDSKYDIVRYNEEGKVEDIKYNENYILLYPIYSNSKIKILKSKGSNEVIGIPYDEKDLLSIKELNTPVIYNARIKNGDVYEFTNKSSNYITLNLIENHDEDIAYDCITYSPNSESVSSVRFDSLGMFKDVAPQQKIKLSVSKGEYLDISVPYEFKDSVKKLSTPMFQKIEIKKGNSYEFKASKYTHTYIRDKNNDFIYDYLIYDKDGNHSSTYMDMVWALGIDSHNTYRVAVNSKSNMEKLEFYIPYEDRITVKELNHPLIKTIILDNKNNYEIVNKTGKEYRLELAEYNIDNDKKYECILYDKNNNIKYMNTDVYSYFPCDGKVKISIAKGNNLTLYIPYDFEYELNYINDPLIFKKDILANKTYEIKNSPLNIYGVNYEEFDVIQYGENGKIISVDNTSGYYVDSINNEVITKIRLTNGEKVELLLPYENRNNIKETNDLLLKKISLQKDKEYKIKNNNSFDIAVGTNIFWGTGYKITYYDSRGNVKETLEEQYEGFKIKANESAKISIDSDGYNMYVPYEATIVDDDSTPDSEKPILGDFNNDSKVDILDLSMLATKYNKQKGQNGWDSTYDLNSDFTIDLFDLSIVAKKL